ncbi:MAG: type IX secretion system membrane protein PorP/SprF [Flavobacteriales bacterium]
MSSPSHENIDHWLFDYIEGNLSMEQEEALRLFLLLNPSYDIDLDAWEKSKVDFPEIDPVLVESMGFGTTTQEKKRKKRPIGLWVISLGFFIMMLGLIGISKMDSPAQPTRNIQNSNPSHTSVSSISTANSTKHISNLTPTNAYPTAYMTTRQLTIHHTISGANSTGLNNLTTTHALSAHYIATSLRSTTDLKPTPIHVISLQTAKRHLIHQELSSDLIQTNQSDEVMEKKRVIFHLPSLKISKSSSLSKYLRKEVLSATQKDRVLFVQEKSYLDVADAFAGNRSQTRIQSTSMARWLGDANQKLTQQLSIDGYSRSLKSGFGLVANYTDFGKGSISDWNVRFIYSPKLALGKFISIEPSVSYMVGQKTINTDKITNYSFFEYTSNQMQQFSYSSNNGIGSKLYYRDLNAGINVNAGPIYAGISAQNILKHQDNVHTNNFDTIDRASQISTVYVGTDFSARKGSIMFSPMLSHTRGFDTGFTQIGATLQLNRVVFGANYGSNDSFGALFGYQAQNFSIIAQSLKTKPLTSIQPQYVHQLTVRINSNISRKTRRYLYL